MARPVGSNVAPIAVSRTCADSKAAGHSLSTDERARTRAPCGGLAWRLAGRHRLGLRPCPDRLMPADLPVALGVLWAANAGTRGIDSATGYRLTMRSAV